MNDGKEGWSNEEAFLVEECDPDYEFDAARFYDFGRSETCSEAEAAERWFESAGTYPPSPFIVKLRWSNHDLRADAESSSKMYGQEDMNSVTTVTDGELEVSALNCSDQAEETLKVQTKPLVKSSSPRSSTLMKPTASYLAKQNQSLEVRFCSFLRSDKFSVQNNKTRLQNSPLSENRATKRQKLDTGYLKKVADLKHQAPLHHKLSKKVGYDIESVLVRRNFTIPREFSLETAHRAQRHSFRSKNRVECGEHAKSNSPVLKACQLLHKVPLATLRKKSTLGFQEVDVSSVPASENVMPEVNRPISADTHNQNCNIVSKFGASANNKGTKYRREKHDPPVELFEKLSLESKVQLNFKTQWKVPPVTEDLQNAVMLIQQEYEMVEKAKETSSSVIGWQIQCGRDKLIAGVGPLADINRRCQSYLLVSAVRDDWIPLWLLQLEGLPILFGGRLFKVVIKDAYGSP